jgi:Arc/MetJ-type ribon-helix-helix transcriptional regulator
MGASTKTVRGKAMTTIPVQLPDDVRDFAESHAKTRGFASVGEFISSLVAEARESQVKLEGELLEGLDSGPASAKTDEDWRQMKLRVARKVVG